MCGRGGCAQKDYLAPSAQSCCYSAWCARTGVFARSCAGVRRNGLGLAVDCVAAMFGRSLCGVNHAADVALRACGVFAMLCRGCRAWCVRAELCVVVMLFRGVAVEWFGVLSDGGVWCVCVWCVFVLLGVAWCRAVELMCSVVVSGVMVRGRACEAARV